SATAVINLRVMVPDVDQIWQRATELGTRIIVPIGDRRYGLRDFTIADPDGFELRFATRLRTSRAPTLQRIGYVVVFYMHPVRLSHLALRGRGWSIDWTFWRTVWK